MANQKQQEFEQIKAALTAQYQQAKRDTQKSDRSQKSTSQYSASSQSANRSTSATAGNSASYTTGTGRGTSSGAAALASTALGGGKYAAEAETVTAKNRDAMVKEYQAKTRELDELESFVTTPEQNEALNGKREELAKLGREIDEADEALGNGKHLYNDQEKVINWLAGVGNERLSQDKGFAGNVLQTLDLYGSKEAEKALKQAGIEEMPEQELLVGNASAKLMESAQSQREKAREQKNLALQDENGATQFAANVAEAGLNVLGDQIENMIIPGSGALRMYAGAWGGSSMDQAGKENNSIEAQALAGVKSAAAAYLSTKLLGGIETYGESAAKKVVPQLLNFVKKGAGDNPVVKVLANTEGFEEALEDVLNYAGDKLLGLDPNAELVGKEVFVDGVVGYILGVMTAGLSAGINYTPSDLHQIADEAIASGQKGETFEQAVKNAAEQNGTAQEAPIVKGEANVQQQAGAEPAVEAEPEESNVIQLNTNNPTAEPTSQIAPESPQTNESPQMANDTAEQAEENLSGLTRENETSEETQTEQPQNETSLTPETGLTTQQRRAQESWDAADPAEKVSRFYWNTLMKNGLGDPDNPLTYIPKSEQQSMANAYARLQNDFTGEVNRLMNAEAWSGEQMDMAYMIQRQLHAEGRIEEQHAWEKVMQEHATSGGQGIQAIAKQSRPDSMSVAREVSNIINDAEAGGNADPKMLEAIRTETDALIKQMDDAEMKRAAGDEEGAKAIYLDIADKANKLRNTGFISDAVDAKLSQQADKLGKRFRRMLAKQDLDFIQRFVACQTAGVAEDIKYKTDVDLGAKINTFQKLAQLTGTGTWLRNAWGNSTFGLVDLLSNDNPVTLIMDAVVGKKTGKRSTGLEKGLLEKGTMAEAKRALEKSILEVAANIDLAEETDNTKYDLKRTRTFDTKAIGERALSRWEQWNAYMLTSSDKFFRGGIENSVEQALIRANGWDAENLTADQRKQIDEVKQQVADYRLFQNQGIAAKGANKLRDLFNLAGFGGEGDTHKGGFGLGTALLPYSTVPANIGVKLAEFSPLGAAKGMVEIATVLSKANSGKDVSLAAQNKAITDFGRGITGTALIAALAAVMKNGEWFKDWENEDNKNVKYQNKLEGKSGQQINLSMLKRIINGDRSGKWQNGDHLVDISAIEPLTQLLTAASLIAEGNSFGDSLTTAVMDTFAQIPSLQTINNIQNQLRYIDTLEDGGNTVANFLAATGGNVAAGFIPAPLRHLANITDKYQRDTSGNNNLERSTNQLLANLPGIRQNALDVKTDAYGNEVTQGSVGTRIANQLLALKYTEVNQSDVSREIQRIRKETGDDYTPDYAGPKSITTGSGKNKETAKLTTEQSREYKNTAGTEMTKAVERLMKTGDYRGADPAIQSDILAEIQKYSRDKAKGNAAKELGLKRDSDYKEIRTLNDPVRYLASKVRFNQANNAEDWDDVDQVTNNMRLMSEKDREFALSKNNKLKSFWNAAEAGVKAETVNDYSVGTKARAEARGAKSVNGMDIFTEIASGKYSKEAADYFMNQQESDGDYKAGKGRHYIYEAVTGAGYSPDVALDFWNRTQQADVDAGKAASAQGTLTKKEFSRQVNAFPEPYRSQIKKAVYAAMGW